MTATTDEQRQHTMRVRALRRLSSCEVAGLGIALEQLEAVEVALSESMPKVRRAAEQEAQVRHAKRLDPYGGPYVGAHRALVGVLEALGVARDETSTAETLGKVVRR